MNTAARPRTSDSAHWYYLDGRPCYELPKADGKGTKNPTLADARKLNLSPGVTTILKILAKPALDKWKIEQAVLAVATSPRKPDETDDAFIERIINVEMVQEQERDFAAKRGTRMHEALEKIFLGRAQDVPPDIRPWVQPAADYIMQRGELVACEKILCGKGYAGKTDLILKATDRWLVWDWKSAKKLPTTQQGAWPEHRLQLSAYARAYSDLLGGGKISVGNVYISSVRMGEFVVCEHDDWFETFERGFWPLLQYWQFANNYAPNEKIDPLFNRRD